MKKILLLTIIYLPCFYSQSTDYDIRTLIWDMTPEQVKEKEQCLFEKSTAIEYRGELKYYLKDEKIDEYVCNNVLLGSDFEAKLIKYYFINNCLKEVVYVFDWKASFDSTGAIRADWGTDVFSLLELLEYKYGSSSSRSTSYDSYWGYNIQSNKSLMKGNLNQLSCLWYTKTKRTLIRLKADARSGKTSISYVNNLFEDMLRKKREDEEKKKKEDTIKEF